MTDPTLGAFSHIMYSISLKQLKSYLDNFAVIVIGVIMMN